MDENPRMIGKKANLHYVELSFIFYILTHSFSCKVTPALRENPSLRYTRKGRGQPYLAGGCLVWNQKHL